MRANNVNFDFYQVVNGHRNLLASVRNSVVEIINDGLRRQMEVAGINIPHTLQTEYGNKPVVQLGRDREFDSAFVQVHIPYYVKNAYYSDSANGIETHYETEEIKS